MKIAKLKISNVLGITELEVSPGQFNEITGQNGQGKTSVLEAIKAVVEGGNDATLLRKGAEQGEVVLVLDDGTRISKRVTEKASPLTVTTPAGEKLKRPTDFIKDLVDLLSVNPVDFLRAPKKDRVRVLLETMPIEVDAARLEQLSGIPVQVSPGTPALNVIKLVRDQVADDRKGTKRAIDEKEGTVNQLRLAMPDAPAGVTGSEDDLRAQRAELDAAKDAELDRIRSKLADIKATNVQKIADIRADAQAKIDQIKAEAQAAVDAVHADERDKEAKAATVRERAITKHAETVAPINQALEAIRADRNAAAKREQTLDTIQMLEREVEDLRADLSTQEQAIKDVDAYREQLLASLPIPGLEVIDGDVFRNGIQFDRLNTAQQVDIAVEIAKLRAGELGICCVDGIELLDSAAFEEFKRRAIESGLQLFVTRVSDEQFQVKTCNLTQN